MGFSVHTGRDYAPELPWLDNALAQHASSPFQAIIAANKPAGTAIVLRADEVDESNPLVRVSHDAAIERSHADIAAALDLLLRTAQRVLIVDPYYDPFDARYQGTLRACLAVLFDANPKATCEIHHKEHKRCPPADAIERNARTKFVGVIPNGKVVTIYRWQEIDGGTDFHARYLLTDKGGIAIDAGFSAEGGHQTTDMHLMSSELAQAKVKALARGSRDYDLIEPVMCVGADGGVTHV
jgi:hypothetical protein